MNTPFRCMLASLSLICAVTIWGVCPARGAELVVGTATADITPSEPVPLAGQMHTRIATKAETPVTANVLLLLSREGDKIVDQATFVSCDLVGMGVEFVDLVRKEACQRVPEIAAEKIVLNATHTHTAPEVRANRYTLPDTGVMKPEAYRAFAAEKIGKAVEQAWKSRTPGSFTWGLSHAVVAQNRRAVYADGTAVMYGKTNRPDFQTLEGYEDHDVGALFFWNQANKMAAMAVDVSCPAQEVEGLSVINADYWHPARELLHKQFGPQVTVLGWIGAAGDQSPHLMVRKAAEERMRELRKLSRTEELGRRIDNAVDEAYEAVKDDRHSDVPLVHKAATWKLSMRLVTEAEYNTAKQAMKKLTAPQEFTRRNWFGRTVERYEAQQAEPHPTLEVEVHVIRLGDVAICTNPFELFTDYGMQIKARSRAMQTFIIQLSGPGGGYLPSPRAVAGGGYSAVVQSSRVGPKGGQELVERTVELMNSLWPEPAK